MALPPRRAANRRRSRGNMQDGGEGRMGQMSGRGRGPNEDNERGGGGRMSGHRTMGSPASIGARKGAGPVPGAGELRTPHNGPGAAAAGYAGMDKTMYPSRKTPPGTPSGHMDVYPEGSGSNKSRT